MSGQLWLSFQDASHTCVAHHQERPNRNKKARNTIRAASEASRWRVAKQLLLPMEEKKNEELDSKKLSSATEDSSEEIKSESSEATANHSLPLPQAAKGEKAKAHDILAAVRILKLLDRENRNPTTEERTVLTRFGGFGAVALRLFPDPVTGDYKDPTWRQLGEELKHELSQQDYESAKRTTFNAFYTSPVVTSAMYGALQRLGAPSYAMVLEPGCGAGNFLAAAPAAMRFIGVEMDRTSGRLARALYPQHDIRIESFQKTTQPENSVDVVIGNVPFANVKLPYKGRKYSLHDFFLVKSIDLLRPSGLMAVVTSRFTLDKRNAATREQLAEQADFLGAFRLPAEAFQREGTSVVTDVMFFRKRAPEQQPNHRDDSWLETTSLSIEDTEVGVNRYFVEHPDMVLGDWTLEKQLYAEGFSVRSNGDLETQLQAAISKLPEGKTSQRSEFQPVHDEVEVEFARPPPLAYLTEGSLFVSNEGVVCQKVCRKTGEGSAPLKHGDTPILASRGKTGKRLAALIALRDAARQVLQSQNEGWPVCEREAMRDTLNKIYDSFYRNYGPINKTTFGQTRKGSSIRRMPNLVKFRHDPDAMLVMSLEDYDEVSGNAAKAPILLHDVVGKKAEVTSVRSVEEGLLVSLDRHGEVRLPFIAELYGTTETEVIKELGDLIYQDPLTLNWETADVYLSGNVRAKLDAAEAAGEAFSANAEALRRIQPPDVLPGDIDAKLGSPWLPVDVIQAFATEAFGVANDSLEIAHIAKEATWSVEADYTTLRVAAVTTQYGTQRVHGVALLQLALNMKTPLVYDTVYLDGKETRIVNQADTLAAKEKQKLLKDAFRSWVFEEPQRAERLVRIYNDTYNNLRLRLFDGSHLEFPGMNPVMELRTHQKNAVWRCMSSGNTLLAHTVGAGKTFVMAATGMKLKEAGIVQKPMFVVPNHMLEQFAREFMQLYPNARLLVATKEDMARDRRKQLTARIASGSWDGVIVTHSSFERVGMSPAYQEKFLREQIEDYEDLLLETTASDASRSHRNLIKTIEKQKASREAKLAELSAEQKKDDGLVFDELGVDHIFIDEAHYFKNLETPTKMQRVAGIQTGGSQRAFDLLMKSRYLDAQNAGRGITFSTATPISNTMVEMYTLQRFLDPRGLLERGVDHFDAWAANFGEVVELMEISPDGASLRQRSRFARFNNLPELQQMFRAFTDVQTVEMLKLPGPRLAGGKPTILACPMSDHQLELQDELVKRYERLRASRIDPREDNALAITTDGRKLSLDARLLSADAVDHPESKVNALVENIGRIWARTFEQRGTQIVFCDMGVHPTDWGYCVYDEIVEKLVESGIPREQIATMREAASDARKQSLFERVRNGSVRVLIGSTQKMGVGTNVQKRLIALHHLDAPWKPAEVEQREGRILRQGNDNEEVEIYRYVTEGSFDAFMWQALETKARFIAQVMTGETGVRRAEDIGGQELSFAEVKAIASGNPAVLTLAEADADLQRLAVLKKNHSDERFLIHRKLRELPEEIQHLESRLRCLQFDQTTLSAHNEQELQVDGRMISLDDQIPTLEEKLLTAPKHVISQTLTTLGKFRGLTFGILTLPHGLPSVVLQGELQRTGKLSRNAGPRAVFNAIERLAGSYGDRIMEVLQQRTAAQQQLRDFSARSDIPFAQEDYQRQLKEARDQLKRALSEATESESTESEATENNGECDGEQDSIAELAAHVERLQGSQSIPHEEKRIIATEAIRSEEPIASRLRRLIGESVTKVMQSPNVSKEISKTPPTSPEEVKRAPETVVKQVTQTASTKQLGLF